MKPPLTIDLLRQRLRLWWQGAAQEVLLHAASYAGAGMATGKLEVKVTLGHLTDQEEFQARIDFAEAGRSERWIDRFLAWHKEHEGEVADYGLVARQVITDAGVAFLVDDWDTDAQNITLMNFHEFGTGVIAEAVGDTLLGTPVETRETGTKSQPAANQLRTVATHTFAATFAITEHGVFSVITTNTITLWDRSVFAAINVVANDAIEATYTATISSGG